MEIKTLNIMDYQELNALIEGIYGIEFDFQGGEKSNDTDYLISDQYVDPDELDCIDSELSGWHDEWNVPNEYAFLADLRFFGLIPDYDVLVQVSW